MKAINKWLYGSFVLSVLLHVFILSLFFIFQDQTKRLFKDESRKESVEKKENIVLLSLSNFQVEEKSKQSSVAQQASVEQQQSYQQPVLALDDAQQVVKMVAIDQGEEKGFHVKAESAIEPQPEVKAQEKYYVKPPAENQISKIREKLEKEILEQKVPRKEKRSTQEIRDQARKILCRNKTSLTQTVTKTDFFRHAKAVAQQSHAMPESKDLSARISGLGNLKLYSYEEKLRSTLLTAFNSLKHRMPRPAKSDPHHQHQQVQPHAAINLIINKDGSIDTLNLLASSGDAQFDKLIIESIQYAAPFPSIPVHLGIDKFRLGAMQLYVKY